MTFITASYFCLALAAIFAVGVVIHEKRARRKAQHPPTVLRGPYKPGSFVSVDGDPKLYTFENKPLPHIHILRVGRSSIHKLTEGVSMRCCVAGCEEPFYMDGPTVDWMRDWLNATRADSVKVQAIR